MSIKILNEGFELLHKNSLCEKKSNSSNLRKALENALNNLAMKQEMNLKKYEVAFQDAIESQYPDKSWWEVTDCDIFWDLSENKDPSLTIEHILDKVKPEFKESLEEGLEDKFFTNAKADAKKLKSLYKKVKDVDKAFKSLGYSYNGDSYEKKVSDGIFVVFSETSSGRFDYNVVNEKERTGTASDVVVLFKEEDESFKNEALKRKRLKESDKDLWGWSKPKEKGYWYFTTHGVQPGSIPRGAYVIEERDGQNEKGTWGTYVMLDRVLSTKELRDFDMRELSPKNMSESKKRSIKEKRITRGKSKILREAEAPAGYSPKKQGKAYKVFRVKNGKLYPPMVSNPGGADTPIGKWLIADEGEFAGLSKTGRPQVKSSQGGTLSYRPGWHLGDIPRASQFDRTNKETGEKEFPKDFVWAECSYTMDVDYQPESDEQGYMRVGKDGKPYRSDKYQHSLAGLPKLPKDGYYKYRTNPRPDTVPWVITGAIKVDRLLSDAEVNEILKKNGIEPIHRQGGDKTLAELGLRESFRRKKGRALKEEWWENNPHVTVLDHEDEYPTNGQWFEFVFDFYNDRLGHVTETNRGHYKARDINHAIEKFWRSHEKASDGKSGFILVSVKDESGKEYISEKLSNKRKLRESKWSNKWPKYIYTFEDGWKIAAVDENEALAKYDDIQKNLHIGKDRSLKELNKIAMSLYNNEDDWSFNYFSDDELAKLWSMCVGVSSKAYDDEVYEAITNRPNAEEIFDKAKRSFMSGIKTNEKFSLSAKRNTKKLRENHRKTLTESFDDMEVFMNTWANYNEYGADGVLTPTGWMSIDDAIEYCEDYAEYEPFINDTDNVPFDDINEYSNASSALQELKELQESGVDEDVLEAIIEATGYSVKEAVEIAESGDYFWYPGLSSYTDLAYAVIDEFGSLKDALGDRVVNYIDEDQMRREYRWDIREIMRDSAEDAVDEAHEGEDEDSYDREQEIEDWMDEHEDEWLDMIIGEDIEAAERGEVDLSSYFDYEAFGRDLSFDGYTIVSNGIILVN